MAHRVRGHPCFRLALTLVASGWDGVAGNGPPGSDSLCLPVSSPF